MTFQKIYKYNQKGKIQEWQILVKNNTFYTVEGEKGGKLTTSLPTQCHGKNIGKSNETSDTEQAVLEAKSKHQKKLDKGYAEKVTKEKPYFEPMLAFDGKDNKNLEDVLAEGKVKVFVQRKYNGMRCVNAHRKLMSRNGKEIFGAPHVIHSTKSILDGELYSHDYKDDFNKIISICKKQTPTKGELEESKVKLQQYVYDLPSHKGVFSERYKALQKWFRENGSLNLHLVETYEVKSWEEIKEYHAQFLEEGFEGTIIRLDLGEYECKRSKQLLKYKDFIDEEFEIIGAVEGEGGRTGTIGKFWLRLERGKPYTISDNKPVNCFKSNIKGNFDYLRKIWKDHKKYIGKEGTVKYFQRTPDNVPLFPYIISIDRKSFE